MWTATVFLLSLLACFVESSKQVKCVFKEEAFLGYNWKYAKSCFVLFTVAADCVKTVKYGAVENKHSSRKLLNKAHVRLHSDDYTTISYECKEDFCNIDKDVILGQLTNINHFSSDADIFSQTRECKKQILQFADEKFLTPVNKYVERDEMFFKSDIEELVQKAQSQDILSKLFLSSSEFEAIQQRLDESQQQRREIKANYDKFIEVIGGANKKEQELKTASDTWAKKIFGVNHHE